MMQTDSLIPIRRIDKKKKINKKKKKRELVKIKESEKRDKYKDLAREQRKLGNMHVILIPVVTGALGTVLNAWKGDRRVENRRMNRHHSNYSIVEIGQNIEKSPGNVKRLAVTLTRVKDHQLNPMGKTRNKYNNHI